MEYEKILASVNSEVTSGNNGFAALAAGAGSESEDDNVSLADTVNELNLAFNTFGTTYNSNTSGLNDNLSTISNATQSNANNIQQLTQQMAMLALQVAQGQTQYAPPPAPSTFVIQPSQAGVPPPTSPLPPTTKEEATMAKEDTTKEVVTKAEEGVINPPFAHGSANSKPNIKELPSSTNRILLLQCQWQEESNSTVLEMARANNVKIGASSRIQSRDTTTGGLVIPVVSTWTIKVISARTGSRGIKTISPAITTRSSKERMGWPMPMCRKGIHKTQLPQL